jgi:hypothetical protein
VIKLARRSTAFFRRLPTMANVDFYALREDLRSLLHFICEETDLRVFESYSEPDAVLREFRSFHELSEAFEIGVDKHGHGSNVKLQLWSPGVTKDVNIVRFDLKPTKRRPHKFRHKIFGVGLIQLHLGGRFKNLITDSHYGHWNEAGARQRSCGNADAVDWKSMSRLSGRIQRHIRNKMAVAKVMGRPILPSAFEEVRRGAEVWFGYTTFHEKSPEIHLLHEM